MRVMITGGTGFIGSNLARGLVGEGHQVVAYDLRPMPARIADLEEEVEIIQGDIRDVGSLAEAIREHKIERIVHLAALLPESAIRETPTLAIRVNAEGTNNVFEAARATDVDRVVYASTDAVNPIGPKEDAACRPTTLYGHLKLLNETMGIHFFDQFGLDTIGLRFGMNYGPGGRLLASEVERKYASAVVASAIERVAAGKPVTVPFHESTGFHWVYVKDNVRAMSLALGADRTEGRVFNVCGDQTYTLDDMARVLRSIRPDADLKFGPAPMPSTIRASEAREMDCSAASAELGYAPDYSFERGLSAYVDALAAQ